MATAQAISITNRTSEPIELTTILDSSIAVGDRQNTRTIAPKDSFVLFTDKIESFTWAKKK